MNEIQINGRPIGVGRACFVIAEAGVNHNGSTDLACRLIEKAAAAGADAVKFQTFKADRLVTPEAPKASYQLQTTDASESQHGMLRRLELTDEDHVALMTCCRANGIQFLSTPFDAESADLLARLGVPALKIPSGEITNLPFLEHVARTGLPLLMSTGMSTLGEVETAVRHIDDHGGPPLALLHCVSRYPAEPAEANLRAMSTLSHAFGVPVGYSDHTQGLPVVLAAVALGACLVEKHFTLDRTLAGPDHQASIEPGELVDLIRGIRVVEAALGDGRKAPTSGERETAAAVRKSLIAARDLPVGTTITGDDIEIKRPGTGLSPARLREVVGRRARVAIARGALLTPEMLD